MLQWDLLNNCGGGGGVESSILFPTRKVTTVPKVIIFSAGITDALLASYNTKLLSYFFK